MDSVRNGNSKPVVEERKKPSLARAGEERGRERAVKEKKKSRRPENKSDSSKLWEGKDKINYLLV